MSDRSAETPAKPAQATNSAADAPNRAAAKKHTQRSGSGRRMTGPERVFNVFNMTLMVLACVIFLYPYVNQLAISVNAAADTALGGITIFPRKLSKENYEMVLGNDMFINAFVVSVFRVLSGTLLSLCATYFAAYALSKKTLPGRNIFTTILIIPMFISGGMIPTFILYRELKMMNTFWVYILPGMFAFYNMIIFRTFLRTIPESLEESVMLDGANSVQIMLYIYVPLSAPVIACISLWIAVHHWNDWTSTLLFANTKKLHTLQFMMYRLLKESEVLMQIAADRARQGLALGQETAPTVTPESIKATTLMVSTLPIVIVYPFLQKYFVKGIMIGAIKE